MKLHQLVTTDREDTPRDIDTTMYIVTVVASLTWSWVVLLYHRTADA